MLTGGTLDIAMNLICQPEGVLTLSMAFTTELLTTLITPEEPQVQCNPLDADKTLTFEVSVGGGPPGYDLRDQDKVDTWVKGKYSTVIPSYEYY